MYPSSSSSTSQNSLGPGDPTGGGLTRYGSAPGSLLASAVDSVIGAVVDRELSSLRPQPPGSFVGRYFPSGDSSVTSESTFKVNSSSSNKEAAKPLLRSYGLGEMAAAMGSPSFTSAALVRQRSSPAGFLSHLTDNNGALFFPFVFLLACDVTIMSSDTVTVVWVVGKGTFGIL